MRPCRPAPIAISVVQAAITRIREIYMDITSLIEKEAKSGCHDSVVFGGFAAWVSARAEAAGRQELIEWAAHYMTESQAARPSLLMELQTLLEKQGPLPQTEEPAAKETLTQSRASLARPVASMRQVRPISQALHFAH